MTIKDNGVVDIVSNLLKVGSFLGYLWDKLI